MLNQIVFVKVVVHEHVLTVMRLQKQLRKNQMWIECWIK